MGGNPTIVSHFEEGRSFHCFPWWEGIQPLFSCHATHPQRSSWSWVQAVAGILRGQWKPPDPDDDKPTKKTYQKHTYVPLIVSETGIPTHKNWTSTWKMEERYQLHPGLDRFFVAQIDAQSSFHRRSHGLKSVRMKLFLLHQMQQIKCYYSEKLNDQIKPSGNEKYNISFSIQYIICILHNMIHMIIYIYMMQNAQMKFWTVNYNQLQHLVSIRWAAARVQCMIHSRKSLSDN